jgi:ankyrin repeat protein
MYIYVCIYTYICIYIYICKYRVLLEIEEVDVDVVNNEGRTPLHYAVAYGHASVAGMLLDAGTYVCTNIHLRILIS